MRIVLSAAEPSGDQIAAKLITVLAQQGPIEAVGIAGPAMRAAGVRPVARMEDISAMGLVEVLRKLPAIIQARRALRAELVKDTAAFIGVDAPDLNLPLAVTAKKRGIPAIGFVSPQIWAWRPGRAQSVTDALDHLLCLFDFEPPLFPALDAHAVGHPLLDELSSTRQRDPDHIALTPGSRPHEIRRILPVFIRTAEHIRAARPTVRFSLCSPLVQSADLPHWIRSVKSLNEIASASAALTKSGTITLQLARMGIPQVVAHRVHPLTHWLGRRLLRGIGHIAMPNILAKRTVIPEYIQHLDPEELAQAVLSLPAEQPVVLGQLGQGGSSERAAQLVQSWIAPVHA